MGCCVSKPTDVSTGYVKTVGDDGAGDLVSTKTAKIGKSNTIEIVDEGVCKRYNGEVTVLVTDMSGFTRLTKKLGIVHFASLIVKMRQICESVYKTYEAIAIETEADNFFVVFSSPESAILAAMEVKHLLDEYNSHIIDDDFKPIIGGYGIGMGTNLIQAKNGRFFGEPFDIAFHLGEDVADDSGIFIDGLVYNKVKTLPAFTGGKVTITKNGEETVDGEVRTNYLVAGEPKRYIVPLPPTTGNLPENTDEGHFINAMLNRLADPDTRPVTDKHICESFLKPAAVIVVGYDTASVTRQYGVLASLKKMDEILDVVNPILKEFKGSLVEEAIYAFTNTTDALSAALHLKNQFISINNAAKTNEGKIPYTGMGIHYGNMLIVKGTNIHWGDPLNTASKLGEDIAESGEMFITNDVFDKIGSHIRFGELKYEAHTFQISHVELLCYSVVDPTMPVLAKARASLGRLSTHADLALELKDYNDKIERFVGNKAVVVTDMSGFTHITRKMGIIHFASLIMKMRQILGALFEAYGAINIETEADNFYVVFPSISDAVAAALSIQTILDSYNGTNKDEDWIIAIGGVGVGYGQNLIKDKITEKLYGGPVDRAFRLGENVADDEVLLDEPAYLAIKDDPLFSEISFTEHVDEEDTGITYYACRGSFSKGKHSYTKFAVPKEDPSVANERDHFMSYALRRLEPGVDPAPLDEVIKSRYFRKATVVMYGLLLFDLTEKYGLAQMVTVRQIAFAIVKKACDKHNGECVEEALWVFHNNEDAVAAVLDVKHEFMEHNKTATAKTRLEVSGFGVHCGDLLVVHGTNVHWGDPVNTASKLGEDIATDGQFFITKQVYESIKEKPGFQKLKYEPHTKTISKVTIECYTVETD